MVHYSRINNQITSVNSENYGRLFEYHAQ
ncbi:protein of unknown function [Rhodovastum atsumiense]|nr:protein of unknown function [Rhodovastum atsumiense]